MCGYNFNGAYGYGNYMNGFGNMGFFNPYGYRNNLFGYMNNGFDFIILLALILLITVSIFLIIRKSSNKSVNNSVLEALKMKYLRGELTEEEYLKRKEMLM